MQKPEILSLGEFRKLKGKQGKPLIVYFDETQWRNLTKGIRLAEGKPSRKGARVSLSTVPGTPGGFVGISCPDNDLHVNRGDIDCGRTPDFGPFEMPADDGDPGVVFPDPKKLGIPPTCRMRFAADGAVTCPGKCSGSKRCTKRAYGVTTGPQGSFSSVLVLCQCIGL